jgi:hypothetical protein
VQIDLIASLLAHQASLDSLKQISATNQKFNRLVKFVEHLSQGVFHDPGQPDHAG